MTLSPEPPRLFPWFLLPLLCRAFHCPDCAGGGSDFSPSAIVPGPLLHCTACRACVTPRVLCMVPCQPHSHLEIGWPGFLISLLGPSLNTSPLFLKVSLLHCSFPGLEPASVCPASFGMDHMPSGEEGSATCWRLAGDSQNEPQGLVVAKAHSEVPGVGLHPDLRAKAPCPAVLSSCLGERAPFSVPSCPPLAGLAPPAFPVHSRITVFQKARVCSLAECFVHTLMGQLAPH